MGTQVNLDKLVQKALDLYKQDDLTDHDRIGFVVDIYLSSLNEVTTAGLAIDNLFRALAFVAPNLSTENLGRLAIPMFETALAIKTQKHMLMLDVSIIQAIIESRKETEDGGNVTGSSDSATTPNSNDIE